MNDKVKNFFDTKSLMFGELIVLIYKSRKTQFV